LPAEGRADLLPDDCRGRLGAAWVQESVPERLDLKHKVFAEIRRRAGRGDRLLDLGFKPSELQQGAARPGQIIVAHPFNPVYLLPLVELVPGRGQ
jgi:carnitine 3-dehydrogenase